jgi:hypothetical protein
VQVVVQHSMNDLRKFAHIKMIRYLSKIYSGLVESSDKGGSIKCGLF